MSYFSSTIKKHLPFIFLSGVLVLNSCSTDSSKEIITKDSLSTNASQKNPDIINGEELKYYDNGIIQIKGSYKFGKREGIWASYYKSGKLWSELTYKEGIKNGPTTTWFENGNKRYQGSFISDKENGKWSFWSEEGKLVKEKDFGDIK